MNPNKRLTINEETACAVEDALGYYLLASANNYGAGYEGESCEDRDELYRQRELVTVFLARVMAARDLMEMDSRYTRLMENPQRSRPKKSKRNRKQKG